MEVLISVTVSPDSGEILDPADVAKDLQLYLFDFAHTPKSNDVRGGFYVVQASANAAAVE